ncbi:hypothetical protein RFI02_02125 [Acinetobacter sichuanensis]|uniref:hypothetical protein n=1 Tax=Acinetobacter sichuanensis TaxID=2136183 RepID=UPI00280D5C44|nr:hypothetical protein [Acinetobacter sichuanensis]MDQ9019897.1 hypothetical protein [Acinetobacter sichuanensis]
MVKHQDKLINSLNITSIEVQDEYEQPALLINYIGDTFDRLEFETIQRAMEFVGELEDEIAGKLPIKRT